MKGILRCDMSIEDGYMLDCYRSKTHVHVHVLGLYMYDRSRAHLDIVKLIVSITSNKALKLKSDTLVRHYSWHLINKTGEEYQLRVS